MPADVVAPLDDERVGDLGRDGRRHLLHEWQRWHLRRVLELVEQLRADVLESDPRRCPCLALLVQAGPAHDEAVLVVLAATFDDRLHLPLVLVDVPALCAPVVRLLGQLLVLVQDAITGGQDPLVQRLFPAVVVNLDLALLAFAALAHDLRVVPVSPRVLDLLPTNREGHRFEKGGFWVGHGRSGQSLKPSGQKKCLVTNAQCLEPSFLAPEIDFVRVTRWRCEVCEVV